ncbi:tetratricopeptide repeat protein 8 [Brevipalpus obovatus]|uniref:tetratricopeptide repeat protein 8 n=1 Tax=Brevipalpus obovatus TaxID=246614 RepID=UPI003D9F536B
MNVAIGTPSELSSRTWNCDQPMDPLFKALSLHRNKNFEECIEVCNQALEKSLDQAFWMLKMRCLTNQIYVDDVEADEEGISEMLLDDNAIQTSARPGTSLRTGDRNQTASKSPSSSQMNRPLTQSGRPLSGILRPGTQGGRMNTIESALKTPRTAKSSRPMTSSSGRQIRIGTASMVSQSDGPFLNMSRLNISKYAGKQIIAKPLFDYLIYSENNVRHALELSSKAIQHTSGNDWFWKLALGKCYYKVGLVRDAEAQFKAALGHQESSVETYLWLGKIFLRLDQPLAALDVYRRGLIKYPGETFLMAHTARVHEALMQMDDSIKFYREILHIEAINIEAIACLAMYHFYTDQPETAVKYYRRLLQMGMRNAEIYNNLALCCYYSQQFDVSITCFEKALECADEDDIVADVWYNIGMLAIGTGDRQLAIQAFRLALVARNTHPEAYNNLGVLEMTKVNPTTHNLHQAKAFFQASANNGSHLHESLYNMALIGEKTGHYDLCYQSVKRSLQIQPDFYSAKQLFIKVKEMYECV